MKIEMEPIGYVSNKVKDRKDVSWGEDTSSIILDEEYNFGLKGLEDFSHVIIIYHLDKAKYEKEKHLQRRPQNRDDMPLVGIFSQRGKDRPNRIGMTSVKVVSVSEDRIVVEGLDAVDGTPVLDIKPYYMYRQKNMLGNMENLGYAKKGKECLYNIEMIEDKQTIIALGADAVTKVVFLEENRLERFANVKDVKGYTERIQELVDGKIKLLNTLY